VSFERAKLNEFQASEGRELDKIAIEIK